MDFLIFLIVLVLLRNFWENLREDLLRPFWEKTKGLAAMHDDTTTPKKLSPESPSPARAAAARLG